MDPPPAVVDPVMVRFLATENGVLTIGLAEGAPHIICDMSGTIDIHRNVIGKESYIIHLPGYYQWEWCAGTVEIVLR